MPAPVDTVFVAWQSPVNRNWVTVARLRRAEHRFRFEYTQGAARAADLGFRPFAAFPELRTCYESERLFPFFSNRLLHESRREFDDFVRWVSPHSQENDPIALLAWSGGTRRTDSLELFPVPDRIGGFYELQCFAHGLRHLPRAAVDRCDQLEEGEQLLIGKDFQNPFDPNALSLRTSEQYPTDLFLVGYLPRYLSQDLAPVIERSHVTAMVLRVNRVPAPIQFRVLCRVRVRPPTDVRLFEGGDFASLDRSNGGTEHGPHSRVGAKRNR